MDLAYQAEGAIQTQKVVQLKPNGKIKNLPLETGLNVPVPINTVSGVRTVNTDAISLVKLTDVLYLGCFVSYDEARVYRFVLIEKQNDGTWQEKGRSASPWLYGSNAKFYKLSETKLLFFFNAGGTADVSVGVITLDGYQLSFNTNQAVNAGLKTFANIELLREFDDKLYFVGFTLNSGPTHFVFSYDKSTDAVTFLKSLVHANTNYSNRASNIRVIDQNKAAVAFVRQYTGSNDHKYVFVVYLNITYDELDSVAAITEAGITQGSPLLNYNGTNYYDAIEFKGDYVHFDVGENYSQSLRNYEYIFKLSDPATNKIEFIGMNGQYNIAKNRAGLFYLPDRKEKWQYEVTGLTNPNDTRIDMYGRNTEDDSFVFLNANNLKKSWKYGKGIAMVYLKIIKTDEGELFLSYVENKTPYAWHLDQIDPNVNVATPIGVARSQSLVTLNGQCGGFDGLEIGKQYYYDANGDISTNPQGTYLGTAISSTTIFIEDTLF